VARTIQLASAALTDREAARLRGQFLDGRHYGTVIGGGGGDIDVFKPDGKPLLVYRRQVSGVLRALGGALAALREVPAWSNQRRAWSGTMGFLDPNTREPYSRATAFTRDHPELWEQAQPLLRALDGAYRDGLPDRHAAQNAYARRTSQDFVIPDTCFTTATVNSTHRFRAHPDGGNLRSGFGVMTVWREGTYSGGLLILPRWRLAVDLMCGDVLLFDGAELHGNGPFEGAEGTFERLSVVAYYRSGMFDAGTADEELERAKGCRGGRPG
jgi:hypothetical protein